MKKYKNCLQQTKENLESFKNLKRIVEVWLSIIGAAKDLDREKLIRFDEEIRCFKIYKLFYPLKVMKTFDGYP